QGVIIPRKNVKHLMLKKEVVEAVKAGKFAVYPIERVEQGLEILTGATSGERQTDGSYTDGTINFLVAKRLKELAKTLKEFGKGKGAEKKKEENKGG
ncbi:MAG: ATP-dependent protease, partial [Deltaproteobacteria bacterium]|nr:ATP-dependent protease [Deltaproteobacteria bacterium]